MRGRFKLFNNVVCMNIDKREMNNIRKKNLSEKRTILLFEIVSITSLLIVLKYHFYEKELSESSDERYLFNIM